MYVRCWSTHSKFDMWSKWTFLTLSVLVHLTAAASTVDPYHPEYRAASSQLPISAAEFSSEFWINDAQNVIETRHRQGNAGGSGKARNVVMFLGDGMSIPTISAARTLLGQRNNRTGEEAQLSFEAFPTVGLAKTYCVNAQVADSACSATAYLCGVKANSGTIGVNAAVPRWNCEASIPLSTHTESIAAWALADGRDAGIVSSARVTHASPAAAYANVANRDWENDAEVRNGGYDPNVCPDIAYQLIHGYPGKQFKVILGGGRREFRPTSIIDEEGTSGKRTDGRNLINEWQADKAARGASYQYIWNRSQLLNANQDLPEYLLGLFEGSHLQYNMQSNHTNEPTLAELTETAIKMLSRNEKGFFLFVEAGRIDHAHHDNFADLALDETLELSTAVARAKELLSEEDSLLVVTADHAHVMSFNGYSPRGEDILGPSGATDTHNIPYMTLSYANGPGFRPHQNGQRTDVTKETDYRRPGWRNHVDAPLSSETHGGDDVAVFASGPHHAMFSGLYEQSHLPHRMAYSACIGPGRTACNSAIIHRPLFVSLVPLVLFITRLLLRV